jgi:hypothetical protein
MASANAWAFQQGYNLLQPHMRLIKFVPLKLKFQGDEFSQAQLPVVPLSMHIFLNFTSTCSGIYRCQ